MLNSVEVKNRSSVLSPPYGVSPGTRQAPWRDYGAVLAARALRDMGKNRPRAPGGVRGVNELQYEAGDDKL